jgi:hypothetical protein
VVLDDDHRLGERPHLGGALGSIDRSPALVAPPPLQGITVAASAAANNFTGLVVVRCDPSLDGLHASEH